MGSRRIETAAAWLVVWAAVASLLACSLTGCNDRYDFERPDYERDSLGQEVFNILRREADRSPSKSSERTEMLDREHDPFVRGVNTMAPAARLDAIDLYLRNAREPIDSGLLPSLTRKVESSLTRATERNEVMAALEADGRPAADGYLGPGDRPRLFRHLFRYEDLRQSVLDLSSTFLGADRRDARGRPAPDESRAFLDLQRALSNSLQSDESPDRPRAEGGSREGETASLDFREILLVEDGRFQVPDRSTEIAAVRFDWRGFPLVKRGRRGGPIYPFVDRDGDGLADVDSQGQFIFDGTKPPTRVVPFELEGSAGFSRDRRGRVEINDQPLFEYVDLVDTGAHFLARLLGQLHRRGVVWHLAEGLPALLGERTVASDEHGDYRAYPEDHPLADALDAGLRIFNIDTLPAVARGLARLIDNSRQGLARLFGAIDETKTIIDDHPDAELSDDSTIGYDLVPRVEELTADPELWADVMAAMRQPVFAEMGKPFATMLKYKDVNTVPDSENSPYERCFRTCKSRYKDQGGEMHPQGIGTLGRFRCIRNCPTDELFSKKTDFEAEESPSNRSISAQLFHLLRDTSGAAYEMRITQAKVGPFPIPDLPPVVVLPGSAEAFIQTIAVNLHIKDYVGEGFTDGSFFGDLLGVLFPAQEATLADLMSALSGLFGANLDARPTPDQITRMFNQSDLKFQQSGITVDLNEPVCHDGFVMANHHADKLFAAEASGLIDAIQPLAKAFSDHGREDLLAEMFSVIHYHYSSKQILYRQKNGEPSPMKGANFTSFEPALLEIAESGRMFRALHEFAKAIGRAKPIDGVEVEEHLRRLVHNAVDRRDGFSPRHLSTPLELPDGTKVEHPSRLEVLLYAVGKLGDNLEESPAGRRQLSEALDDVAASLGATRETDDGEVEFERPGTLALASLTLRELASTAEKWKARGTLSEKLVETWPDAANEFVHSRSLPAVVDTLELIADSSTSKAAADGLLSHLLASSSGRDQVAIILYQALLRTANPDHWVPIANWLGDILTPSADWQGNARQDLPLLSHVLTLAQKMVQPEDGQVGVEMMGRGTQSIAGGKSALGAISDVILNYYRENPASTEPFAAEDYKSSLSGVAGWLGDDAHGLEQLYDLLRREK